VRIMREAVSLHNLILTRNCQQFFSVNCTCLQCDLQWIEVMQNHLVGVTIEVSRR